MTDKRSLYSFTLDALRQYFVEQGFSKFAADQVYDWIYKKFIFDMDQWTNVAKKIKDHFAEHLTLELPSVKTIHESSDGTRKFLMEFQDGDSVETVLIPALDDRLTICVSSQVGCAIGCNFCHTATQGFKRHLKSSEVVGQLLAAHNWCRTMRAESDPITNIVYMGQGEPLHNYDNMKEATLIFMEPKGLFYGQRKITLSTSGLVPQIEKLIDFPPVNIAISLHAAENNIRSELMPINKVYDLERLFEAISKIPLKAHRRITYEYLLVDGLNNRPEDIDSLCKLLNRDESKINLIPFNEFPGSRFKRPKHENVIWFRDQLTTRGYSCTVRVSKGDDILAACGQLKTTTTRPAKA